MNRLRNALRRWLGIDHAYHLAYSAQVQASLLMEMAATAKRQ